MKGALLALMGCVILSSAVWAAQPVAKDGTASPPKLPGTPKLTGALKFDGKLDDAHWKTAVRLPRFSHQIARVIAG